MTNAAASYHLRQLADAGLIERSDESAAKRRAGRPQQRYRMREEPFRDLSGDDSRLLGLALLTELGRRLDTAGPRSTTVDAEVWLRAADRRRLQALVREASELVHERAVPPGTADAAHIGFTTLLLELE